MIIKNLGVQNTLVNQFVAELRDVHIQKDRLRFRRNIERLGEIFAYEISRELSYSPEEITTPLGRLTMPRISKQPVIASILRAGLPLHQGLLNYFDHAENAFISAYRKHSSEEDFVIQLDYVSTPDLNNRTLILADPMLATAQSLVNVYKALRKYGLPEHTHIVSVIAARAGIEFLKSSLASEEITVWTAALDETLDSRSYIVPGLGDAGDLAFGPKL